MYKVYSTHKSQDGTILKVLTPNFFVKINRQITWIYSDLMFNQQPFYTDTVISQHLSLSQYKNKFNKLQDDETLTIKYGTSNNTYELIKMSPQEVQELTKNSLKKRNTP